MSIHDRSVFISYARGSESEEIVNEIDRALQQRGLHVIRDKRELGYKGAIKGFIEQMEEGTSVIVVINDKYLRSANCMFEFVEIAENRQFHDRVFPILLPDANIYDPIKRIDYVKFWETEKAKLAKQLRSLDLANLQGLRENIDLYDEIRDKISGLTSVLKDMNTLTPELVAEDGFEPLYDALEKSTRRRATKPIEARQLRSIEPAESAAEELVPPDFLASLIAQGAQAWNRWRSENRSIVPVIRKLEMTSASLSEFNFSNVQIASARIVGSSFDEVDFRNAKFLDCEIIGSSFTDVTIDKATFESSRIINSDFSGINLSGSTWRSVEIIETSFLATELTGVQFETVNIVSTSFEKAHLEESYLDHVKLTGVSFRSADLQRVHFNYAELDKSVYFQEANLRETEFYHSELPNLDFSYLKMRGALFSDCILVNSKFQAAELASAVFEKVNLANAKFKRAYIKNATFNEAALDSADFSEADMRYAWIKNSSLVKANFFSANLSKAQMAGNQIQHCLLQRAILQDADFRGSDLSEANLSLSFMQRAILDGCTLEKVILQGADLGHASLINCNLQGADLSQASLNGVDLTESDLTGANLCRVTLIDTTVEKTRFSRCQVYGISAWNLLGIPAQQKDLVITPVDQNEITTDELEIAQFFYLLLNNSKLRNVIDNVTSKTVLILGRFTPERKVVLDALRDELRKHNYVPIVFDFEAPTNRDLTETIVTLAHLSRFIVADLTDAKSIPQELKAIVPDLPSVAVQPLILKDQREYAMFEHFVRYPWVLPLYEYESQEQLLASLEEKVITPSELKVKEMSKSSA